MPLHKTFKKAIDVLKEAGFDVTIKESRHFKVTYSKGDFKKTQTLSKTPSTQSAIHDGIADFRRELRKQGYTTLDNFTARLTTEYELSRIIESAAERLKHSFSSGDFSQVEKELDVFSAVVSLNEKCFEKDPETITAHDLYLEQKYKSIGTVEW